jgi:hypothetical protein
VADGLIFELPGMSGGNSDAIMVTARFVRKRGLEQLLLVTDELEAVLG